MRHQYRRSMTHRILGPLLFIFIALIIVASFFNCKLQTYWLDYKTTHLRAQLEKMGCHAEGVTDEVFLTQCNAVIQEHNDYVKHWLDLSCVDVNGPLPKLER